MAGDHPEEKLSGGWKYYNTTTMIGRRNISVSTLAIVALAGLYLKFGKKSKPCPSKTDVVVAEVKPVEVKKKGH